MSDHITINVEKFLEISNSIKELQKKIKEFKSAQTIVQSEIVKIMKEKDVFVFKLNTSGKILELKTKETQKQVSAKYLKETFDKIYEMEDQDEAKSLLDKVLTEIENQPKTVKEKLSIR
jgi:hypothetical protein